VQPKGDGYEVISGNGKLLKAIGVIAGLGVAPNIELAQAAGLPVDNGVVVAEDLTAGHPDIYAAGDVANFQSALLGKRVRVEHEDNAVRMGAAAGLAMAGCGGPFTYHPYFYSDMFELGYEAVGDLDARLETFEDWREPFKEGVIYYMKEGKVTGVLLWNVWDKVNDARDLMAEPGPFKPADLVKRIT
jgi:3-phenylpropionate/trans-cinnamate dioxygenase ferredoxin reductase component